MIKPIAIQVPYELKDMLKYVESKKFILEIGTARGGTLYEMMRMADPEALFVSIDLTGADYGGEFGQPSEEEMQLWKQPKQTLYILRTDSHWSFTVNKVKQIIGTKKFDFIFINGDHSYEGVSKDFELYKQFGDVIGFHDIVEHTEGHSYQGGEIGVKKFWDELKGDKTEIVADPKQGWGGIGIWKKT